VSEQTTRNNIRKLITELIHASDGCVHSETSLCLLDIDLNYIMISAAQTNGSSECGCM